MNSIYYQGHGSLRLTTDQHHVIYIDPYAGDGYDQQADLILVSHQHHDHNAIDLPKKKDGCIIWQNQDLLVNGEYQTKVFHELTIQATQAYNQNHPKDQCVGFLLTFNGLTIYIAADTSTTQQMASLSNLNIDYAFLPCDGIYNMDIPEAISCAKLIHANHVIPYHMAPGKLFDLDRAKQFEVENALILQPGKTLDLDDCTIE